MELQRRSGVALWKQIQDWLEFRIKEGELEPGSRLSCQIVLTPELDGLQVHLPASQY